MARTKIAAMIENKPVGVAAASGRGAFGASVVKDHGRDGGVWPQGMTRIDFRQAGDSLGVKYKTLLEADKLVKAGLSVGAIKRMGAASGWSMAEIKKLARISEGTFARRKQSGRLSQEESERLLRLGHVFERAVGLYGGDQVGARQWLQTPIAALGNQSPVDLAQTEPGAREVDDLIGRIEHGIVS